ncbi:K(+) efflux antiporter 4, partial [Cucurbita argyrosperma subsp. argyrosperma]
MNKKPVKGTVGLEGKLYLLLIGTTALSLCIVILKVKALVPRMTATMVHRQRKASAAREMYISSVKGRSGNSFKAVKPNVTTPLLFKLIPAVVHLGVLLRWFSPDGLVEIGFKGDIIRPDSVKQRPLGCYFKTLHQMVTSRNGPRLNAAAAAAQLALLVLEWTNSAANQELDDGSLSSVSHENGCLSSNI